VSIARVRSNHGMRTIFSSEPQVNENLRPRHYKFSDMAVENGSEAVQPAATTAPPISPHLAMIWRNGPLGTVHPAVLPPASHFSWISCVWAERVELLFGQANCAVHGERQAGVASAGRLRLGSVFFVSDNSRGVDSGSGGLDWSPLRKYGRPPRGVLQASSFRTAGGAFRVDSGTPWCADQRPLRHEQALETGCVEILCVCPI
jgi:hypothetical protein